MDIRRDILNFIKENPDLNVDRFLLSKSSTFTIEEKKFIATQIKNRSKAKDKLKVLSANHEVLFPPSLNLEQSSSEQSADYKARKYAKGKMADLTGGFGIDSLAFSRYAESLDYVEQNTNLFEIFTHNANALKLKNVLSFNQQAEAFIDKADNQYDVIYLDPARRENDKKLILLSDYSPNVVAILEKLQKITKQLLIKVSPMLDISLIINELHHISEICIISIKNECKEVLVLLDFESKIEEIRFTAVELNANSEQEYSFLKSEVGNIIYSNPQKYLYEFYASFMKLSLWEQYANVFKINKLHKNTHLFTSEELIENIPARTFLINEIINVDAKEVKKYLPNMLANLSIRNFPMPTEALAKKLKIKNGGDNYIFASQLDDNSYKLIICSKVS